METYETHSHLIQKVLNELGLIPGSFYKFGINRFTPRKIYLDSNRENLYSKDPGFSKNLSESSPFIFLGKVDLFKEHNYKLLKRESSYIPVPDFYRANRSNPKSPHHKDMMALQNVLKEQVEKKFNKLRKKQALEKEISFTENFYYSRWFNNFLKNEKDFELKNQAYFWPYKKAGIGSAITVLNSSKDISGHFVTGKAKQICKNYSFAMLVMQNENIGWIFFNKKTIEELKTVILPFRQ